MITVVINGDEYPYPSVGDSEWGDAATDAFNALVNTTLQKIGGTFTLENELVFGGEQGVRALFFASRENNTAVEGVFKLAHGELIAWRNSDNTEDFTLGISEDGKLLINNEPVVVSGHIVNADIALDAAIDESKLNLDHATSSLHDNIETHKAAINNPHQVSKTQVLDNNLIVDVDINVDANISRLKLASGSFNHVIVNDSTGAMSEKAPNDALNMILPDQTNKSGNMLVSDGSNTSWQPALTASLNENNILVGNSENIVSQVDTTSIGHIEASVTDGLKVKADADISLNSITASETVNTKSAVASDFIGVSSNNSNPVVVPDNTIAIVGNPDDPTNLYTKVGSGEPARIVTSVNELVYVGDTPNIGSKGSIVTDSVGTGNSTVFVLGSDSPREQILTQCGGYDICLPEDVPVGTCFIIRHAGSWYNINKAVDTNINRVYFSIDPMSFAGILDSSYHHYVFTKISSNFWTTNIVSRWIPIPSLSVSGASSPTGATLTAFEGFVRREDQYHQCLFSSSVSIDISIPNVSAWTTYSFTSTLYQNNFRTISDRYPYSGGVSISSGGGFVGSNSSAGIFTVAIRNSMSARNLFLYLTGTQKTYSSSMTRNYWS